MKTNNTLIYIGLRLFNYNDKIQAELLEKEILKIEGIKTFVPFRDTDEHNIKSIDKCKIIYDEDINRLSSGRVGMLVAIFEGICKDEGVSFEIGYSFGRNIPILLINTDFIWYANNDYEFLFDPVIDYMISGYVHQFKIEQDFTFYLSLVKSQENTFKSVATKVKEILKCNSNNKLSELIKSKVSNPKFIFIDFGGERYEHQRVLLNKLIDDISDKNRICVSHRHNPDNHQSHSEKGQKDIENILKSKAFVFWGDEIEINSGTAALLGLAKSMNLRTIMYETSNIEIHGENNHKMKKNLIIDYSVDLIINSIDELINVLKNI